MMRRLITRLLLLLCIGLAGPLAAEEQFWEYTFRPGDSLWTIAEKHTRSANNWVEIQRINSSRLGSNQAIPPGTRIQIPVSLLKIPPTPARVIALSGDAQLQRADGSQSTLSVGALLYSGDRVLTVDAQSLRIQFADDSELQVLANSEVVLDKLSHHRHSGMVDTRIRLNSGSVNTWVKKQNKDSHYRISTPAAITAVRGTAFRLSSDASQISRTEVSEGLVGVSAGGDEIVVKEGYGMVAEVGKPLAQPVRLLPAPELRVTLMADNLTLQLSWARLEGAERYRYQLATDEQFNQMMLDQTTADNSVRANDLQPGPYYLRLRAIDRLGLQGADSSQQIVIKSKPKQDESWKKALPIEILLLNL